MRTEMLRISAVLCALLFSTSGLAARQTPARQAAPETSRRPASLNRMTPLGALEIRGIAPGTDALQLVRRLRPEFLTRRAEPRPGDPEDGYPAVYVDGMFRGGLSTLQTIPVSFVAEIRYLRGVAAAELVGRTHPGGVIVVSTFR